MMRTRRATDLAPVVVFARTRFYTDKCDAGLVQESLAETSPQPVTDVCYELGVHHHHYLQGTRTFSS